MLILHILLNIFNDFIFVNSLLLSRQLDVNWRTWFWMTNQLRQMGAPPPMDPHLHRQAKASVCIIIQIGWFFWYYICRFKISYQLLNAISMHIQSNFFLQIHVLIHCKFVNVYFLYFWMWRYTNIVNCKLEMFIEYMCVYTC